MNTPLISIIVPIYKVEQYLCKCVDSILNQTYSNLEIWLVDDGSPDNCGKICDEYALCDSRIRVFHKENGGLADARNVAIDVATGEWIVCIDSDDYVDHDYIETLFNLVSEYNCKVGVSSYRSFMEGFSADSDQPSDIIENCIDRYEAISLIFNQEVMETSAWGKIYHRTLFETGIRYPKGWIYEDLPTTYLLFLNSDKVAYTNRRTYNYLIRKNSLEGQPFNPKKFESALNILNSIQSHFLDLKHVESAVRTRLFSFVLHILLEMPFDYPDSRKSILTDYVKTQRVSVLLDSKARKKARVAAIISFLGIRTLKFVLSIFKQRKN